MKRTLLLLLLLVTTRAGADEGQLKALTANFQGRVGIDIRQNWASASRARVRPDLKSRKIPGTNAPGDPRVQDFLANSGVSQQERFPLQSVMKLLVAWAVLERVDEGRMSLEQVVLVRPQDLSLFVQPLAKLATPQGYRTTIGDLIRRAVVDSDSAATDILIDRLGGPQQIQASLRRRGLNGIRIDRDERHLQTEILGLKWRPEFTQAEVLDRAIAAQSQRRRDEAFQRYLKDPRDTATPEGFGKFLQALGQGKLLSPGSTQRLLEIMEQTVTGPDRLKAGLRPGWRIAHKTGTSSTWNGVTAATNDVGIFIKGSQKICVVVFIADCREPYEKRAALMAAVARIAIK